MEISSKESPHKVKNILLRYSCSKEIKANRSSQHPEKSHLLKYFPKYYKSLTLEVARQNPLFSKIKKVKKLQTFTGAFKEKFPEALLRTLLGNSQKNIEEIPQIICDPSKIGLNKPFWVRLTEWEIRCFPHITRLALPRRKVEETRIEDLDDFLFSRKFLMKYLGGMRKLKTLEIFLRDSDNEGVKWMQEKLNKMEKALDRLETLRMEIDDINVKIQELSENKNLISRLTGLRISSNMIKFDPSFLRILEICKKLRSLSMGLWSSLDKDPGFPSFLTGLQSLPRLTSLDFFWTGSIKNFWVYFKPQSSLRSLKLRFDVSDMIKNNSLSEDLVSHWEDITEMDEIELTLSCGDAQALLFIRMFITMVLVKVRRLHSFKCLIWISLYFEDLVMTFEPFFIEQIPHLHESLQKFEFALNNSSYCRDIEFDLKKMKVFRNLKELKLDGKRIVYENVEDMVSLLQENQYSLLELKSEPGWEPNCLRDTMEKIYKAKRKDRNLKIMIELSFRVDHMGGDDLSFLGELCSSIQSAGFFQGLFVSLSFVNPDDACYFEADDLQKVISHYGEIRNLTVKMRYFRKTLEYRKMEGEKKQWLLVNGKSVL